MVEAGNCVCCGNTVPQVEMKWLRITDLHGVHNLELCWECWRAIRRIRIAMGQQIDLYQEK